MRWTKYLETGVFSLSVPVDTPLGGNGTNQSKRAEFWTMFNPYWDLEIEAPETFKSLKQSALVIFKGDLKCVIRTEVKMRTDLSIFQLQKVI